MSNVRDIVIDQIIISRSGRPAENRVKPLYLDQRSDGNIREILVNPDEQELLEFSQFLNKGVLHDTRVLVKTIYLE